MPSTPSIRPLQIGDLAPAGLLSGRAGQVQVGAGLIRTPKVPKPAFLQFIPQNSQTGNIVGQEINKVIGTAQKYATEIAQQEAQASAYDQAIETKRAQESRYYGTSAKPGLYSESGSNYYQAVQPFMRQYDDDVKKTADGMAPYAASVYLAQVKGYRDSLERGMQVKARKEWDSYVNSANDRLSSENMDDISSQAVNSFVQDMKTGSPAELQQKAGEILDLLMIESTRRQVTLGMTAEANDVVIADLMGALYGKGRDGEVVADQLYEQYEGLIMDPAYKEAIYAAKMAAIDRPYKELQKQNLMESAQETNKAYKGRANMIKALDGPVGSPLNESQARTVAASYYAINGTLGKQAGAYVGMKFNEGAVVDGSEDFITKALVRGWSPGQAAVEAEKDGLSLTKDQMKDLRKNYVTKVGPAIGQYLTRFKDNMASYMTDDMPANMLQDSEALLAFVFGRVAESEVGKRLIANQSAMLRTKLQVIAGEGDMNALEPAYQKHVTETLDLTMLDSVLINIAQDDSLVPKNLGIYGQMDLAKVTTIQGLASEILRLTPTNLYKDKQENAIRTVSKGLYLTDETEGQLLDIFFGIQDRMFIQAAGDELVKLITWRGETPGQRYTIQRAMHPRGK